MAPEGLEKTEFAPGNGMASQVPNPQDLVCGRGAAAKIPFAECGGDGPGASLG